MTAVVVTFDTTFQKESFLLVSSRRLIKTVHGHPFLKKTASSWIVQSFEVVCNASRTDCNNAGLHTAEEITTSSTTLWLTTPAAFAQTENNTTCWGHATTIVGTSGSDRIVGTQGQDVIVALGGDDTVRAQGGDDFICSGPGNDQVFADAVDDHVNVGTGNNYVRGGTGDDGLFGEFLPPLSSNCQNHLTNVLK